MTAKRFLTRFGELFTPFVGFCVLCAVVAHLTITGGDVISAQYLYVWDSIIAFGGIWLAASAVLDGVHLLLDKDPEDVDEVLCEKK